MLHYRSQIGLPLAEAGRIGGRAGVDVDSESVARRAIKRAVDDRDPIDRNHAGGDYGKVLKVIWPAVSDVCVRWRNSVVVEIDAQPEVFEDAVADNRIANGIV